MGLNAPTSGGTGVLGVSVGTSELEGSAVTTAKIADDAVTLAKMAAGTAGNLITYNASGDPAAVATGTATHVLTSNGAGAAPTFQAPAAAGGDVVGPASSTDNAVVRFDSTTGKLIQNHGSVTLSDAGTFAGAAYQTVSTGVIISTTLVGLGSAGIIGISDNTSASSGTRDTTLVRNAAGVWRAATTGGTGAGWVQWGGEAYLAADGTNATATMATTGLSVNVTTGRKYGFKMVLYINDSLAADGAKIDFDGGSATATNFRAHATLFDTALLLSSQSSALATDFAAATVTGDAMVEVYGAFEPSSTGTFIPRYAQNAHTTGTLTIYRGSHLLVWDMP